MGSHEHELWEYAAGNRARIETLELEVMRVRERLHELSSEIAALRYLGEQVGELARQVSEVTGQLQKISRRAVARPSPAGLSAAAGWVAAIVAVVALVLTLTHQH